MAVDMSASNALEAAIDAKIAKAAPKRTQANGTVKRVDADGTAYVQLEGADVDTPVARTAAALKVGQEVGGTVRNGELVIDGNYSAPATDDTTANAAIKSADKAAKSAKSAQDAAKEAQKVADATNQHFWHDGNGVHVTEAEGDATTEHNILMNSLGILLRKALNNLVSITASAISFFDGSGNTAQHVTATFGGSGASFYAGGSLRQKTDANGSHYYASDGTTEVLQITTEETPTVKSALLKLVGSSEILANGSVFSVDITGTASDPATEQFRASGPTYGGSIGAGSDGTVYIVATRKSDGRGTGMTSMASTHANLLEGYLDFDTMPNASTDTDFFATGIQAFANGGRLRYKNLANMRSWLGLDELVKVVSNTSSEIPISAGGNHAFAPTLTIPSGYTLVGSLGCKYTANNANLSTAACYKYSATQIAAVVVNHGSSARSVSVTTYGLCVRTEFVG